MTGFEPATPRTPCVCATRLRHIPNKLGTFCRGVRIRTYTLIPLFYWYYPFKFTLFQWFWILLVSTFFYSNRYLKELIFKSSVKVMFPYLSENNLWLKFTSIIYTLSKNKLSLRTTNHLLKYKFGFLGFNEDLFPFPGSVYVLS